jgi:hypothetical protein
MDADFGPFFLKFGSYLPYNARLCLNGHEWAMRQAAKAGIEYTALDNAFAAARGSLAGADLGGQITADRLAVMTQVGGDRAD